MATKLSGISDLPPLSDMECTKVLKITSQVSDSLNATDLPVYSDSDTFGMSQMIGLLLNYFWLQ